VEFNAQDVRDVQFGTTRVKAGYDMSEVDAFLDKVEAAITHYAANYQRAKDDADALVSQVQQLQSRLASINAELAECKEHMAQGNPSGEHDTIITAIPGQSDTESTAENPVIGAADIALLDSLVKVRDNVRLMLTEQLHLVEELKLPHESLGAEHTPGQ
jgi:DivIVA domain-containing protein